MSTPERHPHDEPGLYWTGPQGTSPTARPCQVCLMGPDSPFHTLTAEQCSARVRAELGHPYGCHIPEQHHRYV